MQNALPQKPAPDTTLARPDRTTILTRGVARLFVSLGLAPLAEFKLANGRRVDVAGLDERGRLVFAEIKSCRADFDVDEKWPDYLEFCDAFYFAVDTEFPHELLPASEGLIFADGFGGMIERAAQDRPLAAARRKAVTIRFARQAARGAAREA
ncbi:MAG: MmcB family DNA repair protein [Pseudomonadota bacterium]